VALILPHILFPFGIDFMLSMPPDPLEMSRKLSFGLGMTVADIAETDEASRIGDSAGSSRSESDTTHFLLPGYS
jgi:hypothetical protein